jgi:hypothetical protein
MVDGLNALLKDSLFAPAAQFLHPGKYLGGVNGAACGQLAQPALTFGKLPLSERVFPADVVPVVNVQRECDHLFGSESAG